MQFEAKEIGRRIAEARTLAGLTQEDLAEMASFSKRSLQDYETGKTIPYKHMREISQLLGREVEWFLHGSEPIQDDRLEALEARVTSALEGVTAALEDLAGRVNELAGQEQHPAVPRKSTRRAG